MNVRLVIIPASQAQFEQLVPLTDHQEMRNMVNDFEKNPTTEKENVFVGFCIVNGTFSIIHIPEARHLGEAMQKGMNAIVLPEINKYYTKGISPTNNAVNNNAEGEQPNE